jgi:hypothetical protein
LHTVLTHAFVAADSDASTCIIDERGMECWSPRMEPAPLPGLNRIRSVPEIRSGELAVGYWHTCVRTEQDVVRCFGANGHAQLGGGAPDERKYDWPGLEVRLGAP